MAKIIGKDALPARQQLTLACADLVNEAFLRQSAFAPKDRVAGPAKQVAMMKIVGRFIELATQAVTAGMAPDALSRLACLRPLARMGEEIADDEPEKFEAVAAALESEFHDLLPAPERRDEAPAAR
jgi:V/A-type H+-transporting ATPase subunit A